MFKSIPVVGGSWKIIVEAQRGRTWKGYEGEGCTRRLDATSTRLNGSVHLREIDRRVARSVASKSMGTAGTAFRTFDSWKTDGQVFSPPLVSIRRDRRGWPCFSGLKGERFSRRKKEEERGNEREKKERERGRERKEKREEKKIRRKEKRRRTVDDEQVGRD